MGMTKLDENIQHVTAASLRDAMGRAFDHDCQIIDLKSPNPERVLFGQAAIVVYRPYRKDLWDKIHCNFAVNFYNAIEGDGANKVLVMGGSGLQDASHGGGTKLTRIPKMNMNGVLCEGRLRDFHELSEDSFATYCHGEQTRWGTDVVMPCGYNAPISFAGVTIAPGDYIYAHRSMAIVIPGENVDDIVQNAMNIEKEDAGFRSKIMDEDPSEIITKGSFEN